jgi:purine-binding chemotaxis protein CheW
MRDMADTGDETQYVTLCLDKDVFAVPVAFVREILDYRESRLIPEGPDYLLGLIDVRGRGTPAIDLRIKLGMSKAPVTQATRTMVVEVPAGEKMLSLGLVADRVLEVTAFANAAVEAAPDVGTSWRSDYIAGVVRRDGGFVILFDLPRLLTGDAEALSVSLSKAA